MNIILSIAAGGALGAVARYLVMVQTGYIFGFNFPFGTFIVNILGSFLLGVLVEVSATIWSIGGELRAMLVVGFLGSFTTFSAFSLDTLALLERGQTVQALGYAAVSVLLGISGLAFGMMAIRFLFH